MIVLDASAAVDLVLRLPDGAAVSAVVAGEEVHTVDLMHVEALSALRRWVLRGDLELPRAEEAIEDLFALPMQVTPAHALALRSWELRGSITPYDAVYVVLAQVLGARLVTTDRRLRKTARRWCEVAALGG